MILPSGFHQPKAARRQWLAIKRVPWFSKLSNVKTKPDTLLTAAEEITEERFGSLECLRVVTLLYKTVLESLRLWNLHVEALSLDTRGQKCAEKLSKRFWCCFSWRYPCSWSHQLEGFQLRQGSSLSMRIAGPRMYLSENSPQLRFRGELVRLEFILASYFFFLRVSVGTKSSATFSHLVEQVETFVWRFKATRRELLASSNATPEEAVCSLSIALSTRCFDARTDSVGLCKFTRDLSLTFVLVAFSLAAGVAGTILEELLCPDAFSVVFGERSSFLNFLCKQVRLRRW